MDIVCLRHPCVRVKVNAGVCGLGSVVEASSQDGMNVTVRVESDCPRVLACADELINGPALDAFEELLRRPLIETTPALLAARHGLHPACPVPIAALKAVEAAAGLALPCDCSIEMTRVEASLDTSAKTGAE
jgi:hypothetical protein